MSIFSPTAAYLRIRIPSHRRALGDAARMERDVLLILRDIFPDADQWIATGQPRKPVAIDLSDEAVFTDTIVRLRRTGPRAKFQDEASRFYTPASVPNLYTTANTFFTPHPTRPLGFHPDDSISWMVDFYLGRRESGYEHIVISPPDAIAQSQAGTVRVRALMERIIQRVEPEDARFAVVHFDNVFLDDHHRIGWLTYLSQPPLVEHLRSDPRAQPFHRGIMLQLSDDPSDMMDEGFAKQSLEFCRTLIPYWPKQLDN